MSYLEYENEDSEAFVETFDEAPLWSAAFGLLMLKYLELKPNLTILDIGSGTGFPLMELAARCGSSCHLYGLDPWINANNRAKKKVRNYGLQNVEIVEGIAEAIPFADNSFDLITSNLGFNNVSDKNAVIKECNRVLKPNGKLALTTNTQGHWKEFYKVFENVLLECGQADIIQKLQLEQKQRGSKCTIESLLATNGFTEFTVHEEIWEMRFLDGSSFLNHYFVKLGWMESWKKILPDSLLKNAFQTLEERLNTEAVTNNGLIFTTPMLYIQGRKTRIVSNGH